MLYTASACLSLFVGGCGGERAAPLAPSAPDTVVRFALEAGLLRAESER